MYWVVIINIYVSKGSKTQPRAEEVYRCRHVLDHGVAQENPEDIEDIVPIIS